MHEHDLSDHPVGSSEPLRSHRNPADDDSKERAIYKQHLLADLGKWGTRLESRVKKREPPVTHEGAGLGAMYN